MVMRGRAMRKDALVGLVTPAGPGGRVHRYVQSLGAMAVLVALLSAVGGLHGQETSAPPGAQRRPARAAKVEPKAGAPRTERAADSRPGDVVAEPGEGEAEGHAAAEAAANAPAEVPAPTPAKTN